MGLGPWSLRAICDGFGGGADQTQLGGLTEERKENLGSCIFYFLLALPLSCWGHWRPLALQDAPPWENGEWRFSLVPA